MKKPTFVRQDGSRFKNKKGNKWRRPKGIQSKMRLRKAGHQAVVNAGYRGPRDSRGLRQGLRLVIVSTASMLEGLDNKVDGVMISSTVGIKKKVDLVKISMEKGFTILNVKDGQQFIDEVKKKIEEKKKTREKKAKEKEKKAAPKKEKKEVKETEEPDKKEQEKREAEKVMITKE